MHANESDAYHMLSSVVYIFPGRRHDDEHYTQYIVLQITRAHFY